jgi:Leucine-rich repeat (LRR) protein
LNRLSNSCLEVVCQVGSLKDLKLGGNLLYGPLDPCFSKLQNLELLDLHGNNLSSLPADFSNLSRLRVLNISENSFEELPFGLLAGLPLTELVARKNQLNGTLIQDTVDSLPTLQTLDVSCNQLAHICSPGKAVAMPALNQLCVSVNRLQALPDIGDLARLITIVADENNINAIPEGFTKLEQLKSVDFSSNDIRLIPAEIGRMESLTNLRLSGNPLREKKFVSMSTEDMKHMLVQRLEPAVEEQPTAAEVEPQAEPATTDTQDAYFAGTDATAAHGLQVPTSLGADDDDSRSDMDDFATPPTSAPASPGRSRSQTVTWPVKSGGVLDRSNTQSSSLHPVICSKLATSTKIHEVQLHHNLFTALPESLTFFAASLTALSLANNQLVGESYLGGASGNESLDLPALKELNLTHNHITSLGPLVAHLRAPQLEKLDISFNRVAALPQGGQLRDAFPSLVVLLASNNHLVELDPDAIRGLKVVDVGSNDIAHLNPRIGLLGGSGGPLERLEVSGNRFRVPRWNVLDRGTEATLRWLRGRVPVAEMGAWKGEDGEGEGDEED